MHKKIVLSSLTLLGLIFCGSSTFADTTTTVSAKVYAGELTMSTPQSPSVKATLSGKDSTVKLPAITTEVTDHRGTNSGWTLSIKANNEESFKKYIKLSLKSESREISVNKTYQVLTKKQNQTLSEEERYMPTLKLSQDTPSKDYTLKLSWSLIPVSSISE
ncbi:MAG: hypothetical protein ACRCZN_05845 [Lactococcus lactis]